MKPEFNDLQRGVVNYGQTYCYSVKSSQASTISTLMGFYSMPKPSIIQFQGVTEISYKTLREQWVKEYQEQNKSAQVIANALSAITGFMQFHDLKTTDTVGEEFRTTLEKNLSTYVTTLRDKGRPNTSINSRVALIRKAGKFLKRLDAREDSILFGDGLPSEFGSALRELKERVGISKDRLGRIAGVAASTIQQWYEGKCLPAFRHRKAVPKLAHALGVETDTLLLRCNLKGRWESFERIAEAESSTAPKSDFRIRHGINISNQYTLRHGTARLRDEWTDVVRFKTRATPLRAQPRNEAWRLRGVGRSSYVNYWYNSVGTQNCPSASAVWCQVSAFLGWLALAKDKGGRGMDPECLTLAYLIDTDALVEFWDWRIEHRCGGIRHRGLEHCLGSIAALLRENTGYLYHHPEYAQVLSSIERQRLLAEFGDPDDSATWRKACVAAYAYYHAVNDSDQKADVYQKSRVPTDPINRILSSSSPIDYLEQLVKSMDRAKPMVHQNWDYLCYHRDRLLLKMMTYYPLREQMYEIMTYRANQSGDLYKAEDGSWHIRYDVSAFKNTKGALKSLFKNSFDVTLPDCLTKEIEHYLKEIFPRLSKVPSDYAFRPYGQADCVRWLSQRIRDLTKKFIPGSPGFGPHAFRHIVATDWLKKHPRDYYTVAYVLQDTIRTVMDHYGHVNADDGVRPYIDYLNNRAA